MDALSALARGVVALLLDKKKTVALAESCTGGMIASALVDCPGVSAALLDGGTQEKPVGLVYMAVQCCGRAPRVEKRVFPGDRTQVRTQAAQHALRMLQEELKEV